MAKKTGKKLDFREYECELIKVVDGDTIDAWIDLGFKTQVKKIREICWIILININILVV